MQTTVIIIFTKAYHWTLFWLNPVHIFTLYCLHSLFLLAYPCLHLWSGFFPSQLKVCTPVSLPVYAIWSAQLILQALVNKETTRNVIQYPKLRTDTTIWIASVSQNVVS